MAEIWYSCLGKQHTGTFKIGQQLVQPQHQRVAVMGSKARTTSLSFISFMVASISSKQKHRRNLAAWLALDDTDVEGHGNTFLTILAAGYSHARWIGIGSIPALQDSGPQEHPNTFYRSLHYGGSSRVVEALREANASEQDSSWAKQNVMWSSAQ